MSEEAHAKVSTTGPGIVGGFGQRPGVIDIKRSGLADDVVLPVVQTFVIIALVLFAFLVSAAAFVRWYWIIEQFISRNVIADMRAGVMYYLAIAAGLIGIAFIIVRLNPSRDIATLGALAAIAIIPLILYAAFIAPLLVYAMRDWIVMGATGTAIALWVGMPLGVRAFRQKLIDPLTMEDSNTRVTLANNAHAIEMYELQRDDTNRIMQELAGEREMREVAEAERDEARAALKYARDNPTVRYAPLNHGDADGGGLRPVEEAIMNAIVNVGFREGDISRVTWIKRIVDIKSRMLPDHMNTETAARETWESIMHTLRKWRFVSGAPNKPRIVVSAEEAAKTLKLPPYPGLQAEKLHE